MDVIAYERAELGITPGPVEYIEIPEDSSVAIYTAAEGAKRDGLDFTQKAMLAANLIPKLGGEAAERQRVGARVRQGEHQLGEGNLNDWLQKAVKAAKIAVDPERQRFVAHTLRAHAETELAKRSGDFVAVCVAIGHKLPGVSGRYNYLAKHPADHHAALYPEEGAPRRKGSPSWPEDDRRSSRATCGANSCARGCRFGASVLA